MQQLTGVGMPHIHFSNKDSFGFNRPSGTGIVGFAFPAMNRWAIIVRPSGPKRKNLLLPSIFRFGLVPKLRLGTSGGEAPLRVLSLVAHCPTKQSSHAGVSSGAELGNAAKA